MSSRSTVVGLLGALLILLASTDAGAQRLIHRVRFGETPTSISQSYYGSKAHAQLVLLANGLPGTGRLEPGSYIRIPTAWTFTARRTTSLGAIAAKYLGDRRRWPALTMHNQIRRHTHRVRTGAKLLVPFPLTYTANVSDTFDDLSQRFYGTKKYAGIIASYNFIGGDRPTPGIRIEIPLGSPRIEPRVLEELTNTHLLGIGAAADREEREGLQEANALLRRGEYWEVPLRLLQRLARGNPADAHIAGVFKLLAVAYVALDRQELAVKSFQEALLRQPSLVLDLVTTSPKVSRVFVDAKASLQKQGP